ncbi:hypothetical protein CERSUDRAFT_87147 [Gelatoporia subvermispora B]|uniref:Uncharacterized protein n=1 Tax=Ceriporiopsis subvermispora (strain B) TaxID=914234 RepID=M2QNT5_CERS8|nr:hypothetical protein CERSUDRAFT_87147 [Gelatoporia subvermispora B]
MDHTGDAPTSEFRHGEASHNFSVVALPCQVEHEGNVPGLSVEFEPGVDLPDEWWLPQQASEVIVWPSCLRCREYR